MNILLLITDLEIGGTPTVLRELAIRLSKTNQVTVACLSRRGPVADQLKAAGVPVVALNAKGPADSFSTTRRLIALIHQEHFDTVFSFLIHANLVAALASRFVSGVRFLQSIQTTQATPRWHWWLQSIVHYAAERVVVPSPSAAQAAMDWASVPAEKIVIIANAVDVDRGTGGPPVSSDPPEDHVRAARATKIGFIGRLDPIKRVPDLLKALAILHDRFTLDLFGEGEDRPRIEREIVRLNLQKRATLHGSIARPQEALASIGVLVLPSAAEGFGLVLIEAMAAGVPVVATDVPGIRDVVKDGVTGLLTPVASPDRLAAAIRTLSEDSPLRNRLVSNAYTEVCKRFSWEIVLLQYQSLFARK